MLNIAEKKASWEMFYRMGAGQMAVLQKIKASKEENSGKLKLQKKSQSF